MTRGEVTEFTSLKWHVEHRMASNLAVGTKGDTCLSDRVSEYSLTIARMIGVQVMQGIPVG